eukprot:s2643_g4.t1
MLHKADSPSLHQLAAVQEAGNPQLPIDDYGDCNDVFQLTTGCKTLPQDKNQRIYVLSLRESRLAGRIRWMALVPTRSMAADALTKPMLSSQMMQLLTTGHLTIENEETHHVQMKRLPPKYEIEENDLMMDDETLVKEFEQTKHHSHNMTRSLSSAASQTDEPKQANRLWTEMNPEQTAPHALELRNKKLQEELNYAMKEITKIKQNAEREKGQLMKRIADVQKENDIMKPRLGEPNAPRMTSEHVPDELFFMPNGDCFHQRSCPTVSSPCTRPMKLAKCKRCF